MKTKVNEIPFVGPRGRKELIERVKELEALIAQSYIKINIGNYSPDELPAHPEAIQQQINELLKQGTVLNAVFDDGVDFVRILTITTEENDNEETVATSLYFVYDGEIVHISFNND